MQISETEVGITSARTLYTLIDRDKNDTHDFTLKPNHKLCKICQTISANQCKK